jgi:hypothetical protein
VKAERDLEFFQDRGCFRGVDLLSSECVTVGTTLHPIG